MSPGITFSLHWWRGIGPDAQLDLLVCRYRFGFVSATAEGDDPFKGIEKIRADLAKLRAAIAERIARDESKLNEKDK